MSLLVKRPDIRVKTVADFVGHVVEMRSNGMVPTAFRGQRFFGWPMKPKLFRGENNLYKSEDLAVRDIVSIHPKEFESDRTMFDRLVRMQHFGLPTRLVDVTSNPLVALWFATESSLKEAEYDGGVQALYIPKDRQRYYDSDRVSCMSNIANLKHVQKERLFKNVAQKMSVEEFKKTSEAKMLVFYIGQEKQNFLNQVNPSDLVLPVYVKPKMANKRIIAQSGAFMLFGSKERLGKGKEGLVRSQRVWIHENDKITMRRELQMLGIHESILFPEIDKTAKFISELYGDEMNFRRPDSLL